MAASDTAAELLVESLDAGRRNIALDVRPHIRRECLVELPMAKVQATVNDIVSAYNRPSVQKAIKPKLKSGVPLPTLKHTPVSAAHKLPKGTMHEELTVIRLVDEDAASGGAEPGDQRGGPKKKPAAKPAPKLAKPIKVHIFVVPDGARTWLANQGYDPVYGARPLKRVIQKQVQDPLAEQILEGRIKDGDTVRISVADGKLTINGAQVKAAA